MKHLNPVNIKGSRVYKQLDQAFPALERDYYASLICSYDLPFVDNTDCALKVGIRYLFPFGDYPSVNWWKVADRAGGLA